ncbi:MAG: terminase large subunit [Nitrospinae bacterium]|nr:terminase large subunit [Nitrospinota bacterium]
MKSLVHYIEGLEVSQGEHVGESFPLFPWERRFLRGAFAVDGDAALSVARGNGKTTLLSGVAAAFVDGPLRQPRAEVIIAASSLGQARISFEHVRAFIGDRLALKSEWRVWDTTQAAAIEHRPTGARVKCIGCDPRRAHGLAPALVLADEPAQWEPSKAERMVAALRTSMGKIPGSRLIALGTRPEAPEHWFSKLLQGGADYSQCHAARSGDPPFWRRTWKRANPSLDYLPSLERRIRKEADEARRDPSKLAEFHALRLNMGTPDTLQSTLLDAGTWERIEAPETERRGRWALGLDLGTSAAMSAAAGYWPDTRALEAVACFPELPGLRERGLADGVGRLYSRMHERGELIIAGRRVSDVRALLQEVRARWGFPDVIVCDRWRVAELKDTLEKAGFPLAALDERGMGFKDGGEDVRLFREACLAERVKPARSLLLTAAMSEARVVIDPAGNAKLSKSTQGGRRLRARDDAAAAAILAVAAGYRRAKKSGPRRPLRSAIVG